MTFNEISSNNKFNLNEFHKGKKMKERVSKYRRDIADDLKIIKKENKEKARNLLKHLDATDIKYNASKIFTVKQRKEKKQIALADFNFLQNELSEDEMKKANVILNKVFSRFLEEVKNFSDPENDKDMRFVESVWFTPDLKVLSTETLDWQRCNKKIIKNMENMNNTSFKGLVYHVDEDGDITIYDQDKKQDRSYQANGKNIFSTRTPTKNKKGEMSWYDWTKSDEEFRKKNIKPA